MADQTIFQQVRAMEDEELRSMMRGYLSKRDSGDNDDYDDVGGLVLMTEWLRRRGEQDGLGVVGALERLQRQYLWTKGETP